MDKNSSVIQSTMVKITVLILILLLLLYLSIAKIYWEKNIEQREFELLSIASEAGMLIQSNYEKILTIKQNQEPSKEEKAGQIGNELQTFLDSTAKKYPNLVLGYYDRDLDTVAAFSPVGSSEIFSNLSQKEFYASLRSSNVTNLVSDSDVSRWDGKGVIAIAYPVYYQDKVVGCTLALIKSGQIYYNSYLDYNKIFIPSIILWIFVLWVVKRSIDRIRRSLDDFAHMITEDALEPKNNLDDLPELKPVFDKISTYLDNLRELNSRLEESNEKLTTIMEGISDIFFSLDRNWCYSFVNEETKRAMIQEDNDLVGKDFWHQTPAFINPDTDANLRKAMAENIPLHWEARSVDGKQYYDVHAYPFARGLSVFFRDITENKERENEMLRLERLNLIGQMAAGISHEVRNPLTIVRGFLQLMEKKIESEQNKEYIYIMISEIDRANTILTDFLSLAKSNIDSARMENLSDIIARIYPMIEADAFNSNKNIELHLEEVPDLELNESEIRQLILNLVRNGLEETPEGGKVTISIYQNNESVVLAVNDQGRGIPPEIRDKIGTPFMTTKSAGTGLGLAISVGIVRRHNARLEFDTGPEGTTFYVLFNENERNKENN